MFVFIRLENLVDQNNSFVIYTVTEVDSEEGARDAHPPLPPLSLLFAITCCCFFVVVVFFCSHFEELQAVLFGVKMIINLTKYY